MTTQKQIDANRLNAKNSTGPRTPQGKERSAQNATKHGMRTSAVLLPDDNADLFEELRERILDELDPQSTIEEYLAERVVNAAWKLIRAEQIETCAIANAHDLEAFKGVPKSIYRLAKSLCDRDWDKILRYATAASNNFQRAWRNYHRHIKNTKPKPTRYPLPPGYQPSTVTTPQLKPLD